MQIANVSAKTKNRILFKNVCLSVGWERIGIIGPNGAGKTTFLDVILGNRIPWQGTVNTFSTRIGYIAQGGTNWATGESLFSMLFIHSKLRTIDAVAQLLLTHKFPIALANRPLFSLSPGERIRAALICIFQQTPQIELIILDEPTYSLDFIGETALRTSLNTWPGGLITVSHNQDFLNSIHISKRVLFGENETVSVS